MLVFGFRVFPQGANFGHICCQLMLGHPMSEGNPIATDVSMEGFLEGADIIAQAMAFVMAAVAKEVSIEVLVPPFGLVLVEKGSPVEGGIIREFAPFCAELVTPQKGATSPLMTQAESTPPVTPPLVIFASDPFTALVTPSSIPTSNTRGADVDLSLNEGSKEVLKDFDDEPIVKPQVSNSDEASDDKHGVEAMGMYFQSLLYLIFLLFHSFPCTFFYFPFMLSLSCSHGYS